MERQAITVEEFDRWVNLPANVERHYEFIAGEIHHTLALPQNSVLAAHIGVFVWRFIDEHDLGHATGADGGYQVAEERYIPDVGYISYERMPKLISKDGYVVAAPDLAIEVLSPTDTTSNVTVKLGNYLAEGTTVWIVEPEKEQIAVYVPNEKVKVYKKTDILDGGKVLQGFKLDLKNIFLES